MSQLQWDELKDRRYETGLDRGVLYLPDDTGIAWNGLTSVNEDTASVSSTAYFFDGVKYLQQRSHGNYSGTLQAYTYPDEFLPFDGFQTVHPGMLIGDQPVRETFGLSYRTKVGNALEQEDFGYKLHLLYNLTAVPESRGRGTMTNAASLNQLGWKISGVPIAVPGFKPANYFVLESNRINPGFLELLEETLYGTDDTPAQLPAPSELIDILRDSISEPLTEPL